MEMCIYAEGREQIIYIDQQTMIDVDDATQKATQKSSSPRPVIAGSPGSKIQGQTLK